MSAMLKRQFAPLKYIEAFFLCCLVAYASLGTANAQNTDCIFKTPVVQLDFGTSRQPVIIAAANRGKYEFTNSTCPNDGQMAVVANTNGCFWGNWITVNQDHTPGDVGGNMLLVNADYEPGLFFQLSLPALQPNSRYEFSVWMTNVCRAGTNCEPAPPAFNFIIQNSRQQVANLVTSQLHPTGATNWIRYSAFFNTPADGQEYLLKMINKIHGGCGNDFAMDDLVIRECVPPPPPVAPRPKQPETAPIKPGRTVQPLKTKPLRTPEKAKRVNGSPSLLTDSLRPAQPVTRIKALPKPPAVILSRANPVVREITTAEGEVLIDLYDNGEIDGDTVTIYHNNELVVSRAGLSAKPVRLRLVVTKQQPHHELVMVANNLGSIPPNTSLMVVTAGGKRYEVFISSSAQKNAKLLIDLEQ